MNRQADSLGLVGQRALDRLLDPPRAVGRELAALAWIKPLHGLHQAHVAFIDQIEQRQAEPIIITSDLHHEAEIGIDQLLLCRFITSLDPIG